DCLSCRSACSARMCAGYDPCRAAELMLLAAVCRLYLSRSGMWIVTTVHLPFFPPFDEGFGLVRFSYPLVFAFVFEMVGNSIYTVTSVLTQRDLDQHCATSGISAELRLELPDQNLSVIGATKVSHYEVLCRAICRIPTMEMGLLDFVKSSNPFKVKVGERTLADNKVPLNTETEDRVISPFAQTISLVDHTIQDELNVNSGKRKKRVAFVLGRRLLSRQNEQADTGSRSVAPAIKDVTSSFVTPTPEHVVEDASHDNVVPPVTSASTGLSTHVAESVGDDRCSSGFGPEAGALSATLSQGSSADDFYESQTIDSAFALNVYAALRNQHDAAFLDAININSAQHVCMIFELCLRYEHDIMIRENFEKKFTDSVVIVQKRDAEIADLKARLEKSEAEAAEVIELCKHMSNLEATVAIKVDELANFHTENVGLDATERRFAELHARIADVRCDMDNDLYPHVLTTIAGQRWVVGHGFRLAVYKCTRSVEFHFALGKVISMAINKGIQQGLEVGIVHGKASRFLAKVEAYDPDVEGKYVFAVFEFEGVYFPLLDELESLKDSLLALTMSAFILKDDQGSKDAAPEFAWFQPSIDQVAVPVYPEFGFVDR
nr:transposase (putative), gypsy type [Tanacetum cinerariifolium]